MKLGRKRNLMHEKCKGEIIVYMDDDDYYPPERINHAVNRLRSQPKAMASGSSCMYIYFKHIDKIYQFGPYGARHSTAVTFAPAAASCAVFPPGAAHKSITFLPEISPKK